MECVWVTHTHTHTCSYDNIHGRGANAVSVVHGVLQANVQLSNHPSHTPHADTSKHAASSQLVDLRLIAPQLEVVGGAQWQHHSRLVEEGML